MWAAVVVAAPIQLALVAQRLGVPHVAQIGGFVLTFVGVPLLVVYVTLRAMVDVGDWLDLRVRAMARRTLPKVRVVDIRTAMLASS